MDRSEASRGRPGSWWPVVFAAAFLTLSLYGGDVLLRDADTGMQVRLGREIAESGSVPRTMVYSSVPAERSTLHNWLALVAMDAVHRVGGLTALVLFFSALVAGCLAWSWRSAERSGCSAVFLLTGFAAMVSATGYHWLARPHLFSWVFLLLFLHALSRHESGSRRWLWALPPAAAVWANLHGGFVLAFALIGAYAFAAYLAYAASAQTDLSARRRMAELAIAGAACAAAACLGPYGAEKLTYPLSLASDPLLTSTTMEWASPNFHDYALAGLLVYILMLIGTLAASGEKATYVEMTLVVAFLWLSLTSVRHSAHFALATFPVFARHGAFLFRSGGPVRGPSWRAGMSLALGSAALAAAVALAGVVRYDFSPDRSAIGAVRFLKGSGLVGRAVNTVQAGNLMIYEMAGRVPTYVDGRTDAYGRIGRWREYARLTAAHPGWEEALESYGAEIVVYSRRAPLVAGLLRDRRWALVYADNTTDVFLRRSERFREAIAANAAARDAGDGKE